MRDRFQPARRGDWVLYCDICGQKCFASESVRLHQYTGRGGLIVCKNDRDAIDPGLIPYTIDAERPIPYTRTNHQNVTNGSAVVDPETSTDLGV